MYVGDKKEPLDLLLSWMQDLDRASSLGEHADCFFFQGWLTLCASTSLFALKIDSGWRWMGLKSAYDHLLAVEACV